MLQLTRWFMVFVIIFVVSCARREKLVSNEKFLLGTYASIKLLPIAGRDAGKDILSLFDRVRQFETVVSAQRADSLLSQLNKKGMLSIRPNGKHWFLYQLLLRAKKIAVNSGGSFDPALGRLTALWQFSSLKRRLQPPSVREVSKTLRKTGHHLLQINNGSIRLRGGAQVDLGAIAKGTAVDLVVKQARRMGYKKGIINFGGDIFLLGERIQDGTQQGRSWSIAIRYPRKKKKYFCYLWLRNLAVVTSGDYERYFLWQGKRYHHILDSRSGYPALRCVSVTVVGPSAEKADAYATALFAMDPHKGIAFINRIPGYGAMILYKRNGSIEPIFSHNFKRKYGYEPL